MPSFQQVLVVGLGGALGAILRYLISLAVILMLDTGFPYATLLVNALGCFLLGLLMSISLNQGLSPTLILALSTGLLGGLTTYSTFNAETLIFLQQGNWGLGLLNILLTLSLCLLTGGAGLVLGRYFAQ